MDNRWEKKQQASRVQSTKATILSTSNEISNSSEMNNGIIHTDASKSRQDSQPRLLEQLNDEDYQDYQNTYGFNYQPSQKKQFVSITQNQKSLKVVNTSQKNINEKQSKQQGLYAEQIFNQKQIQDQKYLEQIEENLLLESPEKSIEKYQRENFSKSYNKKINSFLNEFQLQLKFSSHKQTPLQEQYDNQFIKNFQEVKIKDIIMKFNIKIDSTIRETVNKQFKKNIMTTLKGVNLFKTKTQLNNETKQQQDNLQTFKNKNAKSNQEKNLQESEIKTLMIEDSKFYKNLSFNEQKIDKKLLKQIKDYVLTHYDEVSKIDPQFEQKLENISQLEKDDIQQKAQQRYQKLRILKDSQINNISQNTLDKNNYQIQDYQKSYNPNFQKLITDVKTTQSIYEKTMRDYQQRDQEQIQKYDKEVQTVQQIQIPNYHNDQSLNKIPIHPKSHQQNNSYFEIQSPFLAERRRSVQVEDQTEYFPSLKSPQQIDSKFESLNEFSLEKIFEHQNNKKYQFQNKNGSFNQNIINNLNQRINDYNYQVQMIQQKQNQFEKSIHQSNSIIIETLLKQQVQLFLYFENNSVIFQKQINKDQKRMIKFQMWSSYNQLKEIQILFQHVFKNFQQQFSFYREQKSINPQSINYLDFMVNIISNGLRKEQGQDELIDSYDLQKKIFKLQQKKYEKLQLSMQNDIEIKEIQEGISKSSLKEKQQKNTDVSNKSSTFKRKIQNSNFQQDFNKIANIAMKNYH